MYEAMHTNEEIRDELASRMVLAALPTFLTTAFEKNAGDLISHH
ncbi:hypothetical protein [Amycolatopsis sp. CB00013]|nr:hypothetical protein [Amycolatopsis sp. CB00013]